MILRLLSSLCTNAKILNKQDHTSTFLESSLTFRQTYTKNSYLGRLTVHKPLNIILACLQLFK